MRRPLLSLLLAPPLVVLLCACGENRAAQRLGFMTGLVAPTPPRTPCAETLRSLMALE